VQLCNGRSSLLDFRRDARGTEGGPEMSDTPETDALLERFRTIGEWPDLFVHARRLERERDEARELVQKMSESNQVLLAEVKHYREMVECSTNTNNESNLKLVLEEVAKLAKTLKAERDEARNELLKCNEYNDELYRKLKTK
jgi:hypothetical protein